jgi:phage virion morphogenesis protein
MAGATFSVQVDAELAIKALDRLTPDQMELITENIGLMLEQQTKDRITSEKRSPEGAPWAPWSARYAASLSKRNRVTARSLLYGHPKLYGHPNLEASIEGGSTGLEAKVGVYVIYGAIHQFGGRGIPARPYLGLSGENRAEIEDLVIGRIEELLQ